MPEFSRGEIEEAKKRVREMHERASSYLGGDTSAFETKAKSQHGCAKQTPEKQNNRGSHESGKNDFANELPPEEKNNDSTLVLLLLLILLSQGETDDKLLLALLYLLF